MFCLVRGPTQNTRVSYCDKHSTKQSMYIKAGLTYVLVKVDSCLILPCGNCGAKFIVVVVFVFETNFTQLEINYISLTEKWLIHFFSKLIRPNHECWDVSQSWKQLKSVGSLIDQFKERLNFY